MKKRFLVLGITLTSLTLIPFATIARDEVKTTDSIKIETSAPAKETLLEDTKLVFETKVDENGKEYWIILDEEYEKVDLIYYVNAKYGLNFRTFPDVEQDNVYTALSYANSVNVVGISDNGWSIVDIDDEKYFCRFSYLTDTKPVIEKPKVQNTTANTSNSTTNSNVTTSNQSSSATYSASQLKSMGVINWGGWRWTWYSQRVLPGGGLNIPGRHVDSNGYVCDGNGYICLASGSLSKGTVVNTPFGKMGKVYDSGCAANTLDVYTNF